MRIGIAVKPKLVEARETLAELSTWLRERKVDAVWTTEAAKLIEGADRKIAEREDLPAHVDVTRVEVVPTMQVVGGSAVAESGGRFDSAERAQRETAMDERVTLRSHLDRSTSQTPHGAAVGAVIEAIAAAAIELAALIADGPLGGITGRNGGINSDGDQQKDIDVVADGLMRRALRAEAPGAPSPPRAPARSRHPRRRTPSPHRPAAALQPNSRACRISLRAY